MQWTPEQEISRKEMFALNSKDKQEYEDRTLGLPTNPESLERRARRIAKYEEDLAEVKRYRDRAQEKTSVPRAECPSVPASLIESPGVSVSLTEKPVGQRVLTETFVVNRLAEIRQFVGDAKLENFRNGFVRFTREAEVARIFGRFQRENGKGDPPHYCVSASMLGRLAHTFREDYLEEDRVRRASGELALHADVVTEEAKESMQQDAKMFQRRTRDLIDRNNKMLRESHKECEIALAGVLKRMKEDFDGYAGVCGETLSEHQRIIKENTITEDTLRQEMLIAANAHAESIKKLKAHPPLFLDDTRIQLQLHAAKAEEKADDLQRELQAMAGKDSKVEIARLQKELEASGEELGKLQKVTQDLHEQLRKVNSAQDRKSVV